MRANTDYQLQFIKNPWATPCLIIDSFIYNCHSTKGIKAYWRCHNYSKREISQRCRARCMVVDGKLKALTGGGHNHPPHTEKIQKIIRQNKFVESESNQQYIGYLPVTIGETKSTRYLSTVF